MLSLLLIGAVLLSLFVALVSKEIQDAAVAGEFTGMWRNGVLAGTSGGEDAAKILADSYWGRAANSLDVEGALFNDFCVGDDDAKCEGKMMNSTNQNNYYTPVQAALKSACVVTDVPAGGHAVSGTWDPFSGSPPPPENLKDCGT